MAKWGALEGWVVLEVGLFVGAMPFEPPPWQHFVLRELYLLPATRQPTLNLLRAVWRKGVGLKRTARNLQLTRRLDFGQGLHLIVFVVESVVANLLKPSLGHYPIFGELHLLLSLNWGLPAVALEIA